jgi:hypothetical protein
LIPEPPLNQTCGHCGPFDEETIIDGKTIVGSLPPCANGKETFEFVIVLNTEVRDLITKFRTSTLIKQLKATIASTVRQAYESMKLHVTQAQVTKQWGLWDQSINVAEIETYNIVNKDWRCSSDS